MPPWMMHSRLKATPTKTNERIVSRRLGLPLRRREKEAEGLVGRVSISGPLSGLPLINPAAAQRIGILYGRTDDTGDASASPKKD